MSAAERRAAIANLKRGGAIAELILRRQTLFRRAAAGAGRVLLEESATNLDNELRSFDMTDGRTKALTLLYDRLGSMPAAERRAAMGNVRRAEALADQVRELIPRAASRLRGLRRGE